MLIQYTYYLILFVLGSGIFIPWMNKKEQRYSHALVQTLACLPILTAGYFYLSKNFDSDLLQLVFFTEIVFCLIWFSMIQYLHRAMVKSEPESKLRLLGEIFLGAIVTAFAWLVFIHRKIPEVQGDTFSFTKFGPVYFSSILILCTVLYGAWRLEQFWRSLSSSQRWEYKFFIVGGYLVSGTLAWSCSYRLTYFILPSHHVEQLAVVLVSGWLMMAYAVVNYRLINRKIYVSRKMVYSAVVPTFLAMYFLGFGLFAILMQKYGLELSSIIKSLLFLLGTVATVILMFSGKLRNRVQFFIITHFYVNKYEYRDEWFTLSQNLQGASTANDIVEALHEVLVDCLYTDEILIWLGDSEARNPYQCIVFPDKFKSLGQGEMTIAADDPVIIYLRDFDFFYTDDEEKGPWWQNVNELKPSIFSDLNLKLMVPLSIKDNVVGIIGLGPEYTGGKYGHDDFDLLIALSNQTASALLAVRMGDKLARAREQQAWNHLSAFVLHDIKNAATMLALLQENAPKHIHEPEFQQDMLELIDDSLRRMGRVEKRLYNLSDEITPEFQEIELCDFLSDCTRKIRNKLSSLKIDTMCTEEIWFKGDSELLATTIENLMINSLEAGGAGTEVQMIGDRVAAGKIQIEVSDNGPGIDESLLPDIIFEPFRTNKKGGSGIGLWQVKKIVDSLGGSLVAKNKDEGGACFVLRLHF